VNVRNHESNSGLPVLGGCQVRERLAISYHPE
jgi:hypothetical protein